ncbi:MAG: adenylosuccinate lyase [Synergistaceae bacterium]|jgi:adenylosuccinate lyase|nr:adenylosuccinate lyase [Synergistaceae bacterium]
MIDKYRTAEMTKIWSEENKFTDWLAVELAACRAWTADGAIPAEDMERIEARAGFDLARIAEIEAVTQHDVIAFVSSVAEKIGPAGRFVHLGLTSSDVIDTAASLQLRAALDVVMKSAEDLRDSLARKAWSYRHTPTVGRSHGVHAEPTSFGLKLLGFVSEVERDLKRLSQVWDEIGVCKLSGAVGTYANCPPHIEAKVAADLGLEIDPVSSQIIQRDRHARVVSALALYGSGLERLAVEIRHLQRTEVMEAQEPFGKGQKGSSAMPHKKNPILCERVSGMARLLRGYASAALEDVALWHERDISHSSVERVIWPDAFHIAHYMTNTMKKIIDGLVVDEDRIRKNLGITRGLLFSGRVLLALVGWGLSREDAYAIVQDNAMRCWDAGSPDSGFSLYELLAKDSRLEGFIAGDAGKLKELFDVDFYLRYVDEVFSRFIIFDTIKE